MCKNPITKRLYNANHEIIKSIEFPCGGCLSCRLDKQILWEERCKIEYIHNKCSFLTLTYDDYHLYYFEDGLEPSLNKSDCTRFIDNLRHKLKYYSLPSGNKKDFSYFACGEYGDRFHRPHMHLLLFGLDYLDCKKFFLDSWKNGQIKCLPIINGGIRYVVDYMCKDINGFQAEKLYDDRGRERPFYSNSRGLGSDLFLEHQQEIAQTGFITLHGRYIPVPTYYKNLCLRFDPDTLTSLNRSNYLRLLHDKKDAKKMGMTYDKYIDYKRKQKERFLANQYIHQGKPINDLSIFKTGGQIPLYDLESIL